MEAKNRNLNWSEINMAALELEKLISHYGQTNRAEGKSPKTVSWYTEMLTDFVRFLRSRGRDAIFAELSAITVREFIIHEAERGVSPHTVQGKVRSLKAFCSWLFAEGYTDSNLLANVKRPKVPIKIVEPLTAVEVESLIGAQNPLTSLGSRNIAILVTLLDTGLRLGELCDLNFEDAHIEEGYFKVMGKGAKERVVPIGALAQKAIWRYVFHFRPDPIGAQDNRLFLNIEGKGLQPNAVKLMLNRWGKRTGVPRLHAHLCRHTYATNFLVGMGGYASKIRGRCMALNFR